MLQTLQVTQQTGIPALNSEYNYILRPTQQNPHPVAELLNWAVRSRIGSRDGCILNLRRQFH